MVVLAPLVLSNPAVRRDYAVGPGRGEPGGVAPGVVLGWHQGSGLLAIAPAMCRLRPPYHCVLAVSLFFLEPISEIGAKLFTSPVGVLTSSRN